MPYLVFNHRILSRPNWGMKNEKIEQFNEDGIFEFISVYLKESLNAQDLLKVSFSRLEE